MKIYEAFGTNKDLTGEYDVEPFEYEYIGNFKEIELILQHFEENGFEDTPTGGAEFDENGEKLWDVTTTKEPFASEKQQIVAREIYDVDTPDGQRIKLR